jgi:hypothetical protein
MSKCLISGEKINLIRLNGGQRFGKKDKGSQSKVLDIVDEFPTLER